MTDSKANTNPDSVKLAEAIQARRSVRGFESRPIADNTLRAIFELAQQAPSNCNSQPWQTYVVSGAKKEKLKQAFMQTLMSSQQGNPDIEINLNFFDHFKQRQYDCAAELYNNMGIERSDKSGRQGALLRNYTFFDAPHVAFIFCPTPLAAPNIMLDIGIYLQTLMLAMHEYGVASCPQVALSYYPDVVRDVLDINKDELTLLCGISFGYEDVSVPANKTRIGRAPLEETVRFVSD